MEGYDHKSIENKWQKKWEEDGLHKVSDNVSGKDNFYTLVEFSYPSGNLHVGHWYAFAVPDIFARFKKMQGYNVLYPMGFDAFGLPAENAAIQLGADPKVWTYEQMDKMREQLRSMGAMFDWDREVVSCDPKYYKWTQWMFNQFLKNDLVYRAVTKVNWCPKDQTILANEQVVDGCCERCGSEVEQRNQEQWMLQITKYADRLVDDLETLNWPTEIKAAQKNWIGRSEGSEIEFRISNLESRIKVFTTRADTLFGVTYVVLAPEHQLISKLKSQISNWEEVEKYISDTKKKSELDRQQSKEKTGVEIKGVKAINPANGEEISVWVADYVLAGYGTGAVMAVPAHDERDFEFAKKYGLPFKQVVAVDFRGVGKYQIQAGVETLSRRTITVALENKKGEIVVIIEPDTTTLIGGGIDGDESPEEAALREIKEETGYINVKITSRILDNYFSESFRHVRGKNTKTNDYLLSAVLVDDEQIKSEADEGRHILKWVPKNEVSKIIPDFHHHHQIWELINNPVYSDAGILVNSDKFDGLTSEEAKKKITEFVGGKMVKTYRLRDWGISRQRFWGCPIPIVYDPEGKAHPVPEEHLPWLLPTDVDHKPDGTSPLARSKELKERTEKIFGVGWKPEVETMDTFVDSSWYFYRYLDNKNEKEFASKEKMDGWMPIDLYMGGAEHTTMHLLYSRFWVKAMYDLGLVKEDEAYTVRRNRGLILGPDGNKMSKSKGNVIDPDEIVDRLGADTVRMYLAFMGPYGVTVNYPWDPNGVVGVRRFLERVWKISLKITDSENGASKILLHQTIKGITEDISEFKFNTSISKMMILMNAWEKENSVLKDDYKILLQLLAPFAPHITEEIWHQLGGSESVHLSVWPKFDASKVQDDTATIAIQINGKTRGTVVLPRGSAQDEVDAAARQEEIIKKYISGEPKKVIFVQDRLINFVF